MIKISREFMLKLLIFLLLTSRWLFIARSFVCFFVIKKLILTVN